MKIINLENLKTNATEYIVADLINKSPDFFTSHSIQEVSKEFNVSPSTMTRVCQKLGFKSFKATQMFVYEKSRMQMDYYKIVDSNGVNQIMHNVRGSALFTINETLNDLDPKLIETIAAKIYKAKRVVVFGLEQQTTSANAFVMNLLRIDIDATRVGSIHTFGQRAVFFDKNDFCVFITRTGWTKEVIESIKWARNKGIPLLILTADEETTRKLIGGEYDWTDMYLIETQTMRNEKLEYPIISSLPGEMIIFDVIFNTIISLNTEFIEKIKKSSAISLNWNFEGHL
ncbi:RpiR family transcriptional regulator [Spiroplasma clarkii]|uniref:RpiR family transcriptional regulator n=1 Tax=Spiroplasma clarkii TaxID=2139 RepID=A0A1Y0L150_9MOLU|nr:MurR/RpiR family transcriptional regulator [Spiroplasma clarkii]ARU91419.1 RpiR family transcriptional regulator [Spiroplasma clarkii]ATX70835.1 RpiR family transcriptional regulator [Spiroplasma clarkii]